MGKRTEHVVGVPLSFLCVFLASPGFEYLAFLPLELQLWNEIGIALVIFIARLTARIIVLGFTARVVVLRFVLGIARSLKPEPFPAFDYVDLLAGEPLSILLTSITAIPWKLLTILFVCLERASCLLASITR